MSVPSLRKLAFKKLTENLTYNEVLELIANQNFPVNILMQLLKVLVDKTNMQMLHKDNVRGCYIRGNEKHLCSDTCGEEFETLSAPVERLKTTGKLSKEQYLFYLFLVERFFHIEKGQPLLSPIRVGPLRHLVKHALHLDEELSQNGFEVSDYSRAYFLSPYYAINVHITEGFF